MEEGASLGVPVEKPKPKSKHREHSITREPEPANRQAERRTQKVRA
jgi:hypothetical protein